MKTVVLDASIIIKWFQKEREENLLEAEDLLQKHKLEIISIHVPSLLMYELYNNLVRKNKTLIEPILEFLTTTQLTEKPLNNVSILSSAMLAQKYLISFYDASYISLAKELNCDLITADNKLVERVKLPYVKLLS